MTFFYCKKRRSFFRTFVLKVTFSRYSDNIHKKEEERIKATRRTFITLDSAFLFLGKKESKQTLVSSSRSPKKNCCLLIE
jgi:hypothetical protein